MNFPLFKNFMKKNWKLWIIFAGVLLLYLAIMVLMFDDLAESMKDMEEFLGISYSFDNRVAFLAGEYFGMLAAMFPMVFYIILANKLVSKTVDDTSLSSYLSSSISRKKYIITAGVFLICSVSALYLAIFAFGGLFISVFETIDFAVWTNLCFSIMFCSIAVAMLSFFFSCLFAANKLGLVLLIGIPILFVLLNWLAEIPAIDFLKYTTPFSYPDAMKIANNSLDLWWLIDLVFSTCTVILFYLSVKIFDKKQLSI